MQFTLEQLQTSRHTGHLQSFQRMTSSMFSPIRISKQKPHHIPRPLPPTIAPDFSL
jgi:hypothetical protein